MHHLQVIPHKYSSCLNLIIITSLQIKTGGTPGINAVGERHIYKLMSYVQLPGSNRFDSQMQMHNGNQNNDLSLAK